MKAALWIVGALTAFFASSVDADGICYDPDRGIGRDVQRDIPLIKAKGFSHVRTYISAGIAEQLANSGLRLMLGIPYEIGQGALEPHVQAALNAVKTGNVDYIMVGNENLAGLNYVPGDFINYIRGIKGRFPGIRVGTVQRTTEFVNNLAGWDELLSVVDVIGVNVHPFFTNFRHSPIEETQIQWNKCLEHTNGKRLLLTETGWPSGGDGWGHWGSPESAQAYWNGYKASSLYASLADSEKYYFQFFDTPNKGPSYEKVFGLFDVNGGYKSINAGGVPAPVPTTPAPTTPEPTTPEPTTIAPPASNSSSASGSAENEEGTAGSSSAAFEEAGEVGGESDTDVDLGIATNEEAEITEAPETEGTETGGNANNDDATEANTQAEATSTGAGVYFIIALGVAAVGGAFGFIYKARQKAAEIEESESKSFDMTVTPGGACVL